MFFSSLLSMPLAVLLISVISFIFFLVSGWILSISDEIEDQRWSALHCFHCMFMSVIMFSFESSVSYHLLRCSSLSHLYLFIFLFLEATKELPPVSTCSFFPRSVPIVDSARYRNIFFLLSLMNCSLVWGVKMEL